MPSSFIRAFIMPNINIISLTVLRRVFGGRVERSHGTAELGSAAAGGRLHSQSDSATLQEIPHNKYVA